MLPKAALHGLAGDVVRLVEPHSEADPAALLIQFLAAAGNLIGPGPHCMVEATRHALILYPVITGETSKARKGTSWGHIQRICEQVDGDWARNRLMTGLSSAEGLISEVSDDADLPNDRRLLVNQGEFAAVLRIMSREGNTLSPVLRDAWDSGNLRTMVKHDPLRATGAHITLIGHITRTELLHYLSATEAHNGFANRFLWVCARRSRILPDGGSVPESDLATLRCRLSSVLQWAHERGNFEFKRDGDARTLWFENYPQLSEGLPGLLGAATARGEAQVLRLSAIYAALDCSPIIRLEHLEAAFAVWEYCLASARCIFGGELGDRDAEAILEALQQAGPDGMTRTQIRDLFSKHRPTGRIEQALRLIARLGLCRSERQATGGRHIENWYATEATKAT